MTAPDFLRALRRANIQLGLLFRRYCSALPFAAMEEALMLVRVEHTLRELSALLEPGLRDKVDGDVQDELILYRANLLRLQRELRRRGQPPDGDSNRTQPTACRIWRSASNFIN